MAAKNLEWPPRVDAYNLCYARPEATVAAITNDEYQSPLVSFWRRGTGRAGAIAFPVAGEHSATIRAWSQYGDFLQTYNRWLMGEELPPGLSVRTAVEGEELMVELLYTEDWEEDIARRAPELLIAGEDGRSRLLTWERLEPGRYEARTRLHGTENLRGAVQVGPHTVPFGPLAAQLDVEWQTDRAALQSLRDLARLSGGEERLDLSNAWITPERRDYQDIRLWLFLLLVPVALLEFLATRLGWTYPGIQALRRITRAKRGSRRKDRKKSAATPPAPAQSQPEPEPEREREPAPAPAKADEAAKVEEKAPGEEKEHEPEQSAQRRRNRFSKAKTRRKS
jgi:hypothetical protein